MLKVTDLCVSYGAVQALRGISFAVEAGQTVSMVGANGAGKSTVMRALSGLVAPKSGSITFDGKSLSGRSPSAVARSGISQVPEGRQIFPNLTVAENLRLGGFWLGRAAYSSRFEWALELFPRLRERRHQLGGLLSGGEQQMLAMARALMAEPKLLLLDEPSMGLAPSIVDEVFRIIEMLKKSAMTILVVEQSVARALQAADYVYVLELGRVVSEGPPGTVMRDTDLAQAYLGHSHQKELSAANG